MFDIFPLPNCTILELLTHSCFIVSIYILVKIVDFIVKKPMLDHLCDSNLKNFIQINWDNNIV